MKPQESNSSLWGRIKRHPIIAVILFIIFDLCVAAAFFAHWYFSGVSINATQIEKISDQDEKSPTSIAFCKTFSMTPQQFNEYWKRARPIASYELDEYSWFSCYYKTVADGREYRIRLGGLAEIIEKDGSLKQRYHCEGKDCEHKFEFSMAKDSAIQ
jgi:hypothetical protein